MSVASPLFRVILIYEIGVNSNIMITVSKQSYEWYKVGWKCFNCPNRRVMSIIQSFGSGGQPASYQKQVVSVDRHCIALVL